MRGRVVVLTMIAVCVTISLLHAKALHEPTHAAARSAVITTPAVVTTTPEAKPIRNIFAPLTTAPTTKQVVSTGTTLRLAAVVGDVVFQEATATYTQEEKTHYDALLAGVFDKFPKKFTTPLERLTLKKSRTGSRGLSGANIMILRTLGMTDQELAAVSIHELGHIVDMGALKGTARSGYSGFMDGNQKVWADDASVAFYGISWVSDTKRRSDLPTDFVSGYAMSDPFEDFSESFAMYVLHGERFRKLARHNEALSKKYAYMRGLFENQEFGGIDGISTRTPVEERPWDVTVQPYSWANFELARFTL